MNLVRKFFNWISGRDKYLLQIQKQMEFIEELQRKNSEVITFLSPVKTDEAEQYARFINSVWTNRFFKWFLNDIERAVIAKFKTGENADFSRGQLAMIELFALKMSDISNSYTLSGSVKND
jgi:hypothetical protein